MQLLPCPSNSWFPSSLPQAAAQVLLQLQLRPEGGAVCRALGAGPSLRPRRPRGARSRRRRPLPRSRNRIPGAAFAEADAPVALHFSPTLSSARGFSLTSRAAPLVPVFFIPELCLRSRISESVLGLTGDSSPWRPDSYGTAQSLVQNETRVFPQQQS